ncbi:hypothetical protein BX616_005461, partial [Lobosporangium transversale]
DDNDNGTALRTGRGSERQRDMIDNVDMTDLGGLRDVVEYFKDRRRNRDESLWPELRTINVRFNINGYDEWSTLDLEMKKFRNIIKKYRPEIEVVSIGMRSYELVL